MNITLNNSSFTSLTFAIICSVSVVNSDTGEKWSDHPEWIWFDGFETENNLTVNYRMLALLVLQYGRTMHFRGPILYASIIQAAKSRQAGL